jgi:hypothetical protein
MDWRRLLIGVALGGVNALVDTCIPSISVSR